MFIGVLAAASLSANSTYNVTITTPSDTAGTITGETGYLEWDLISGGGAPFNVVGIESFVSDGTLGDVSTQMTTGDVCPDTDPSPCTPPPNYVYIGPTSSAVMIDDPVDNPYNAYAIEFTFGTTITFTINATTNGPGAGVDDELSFFLYDQDDATPLVPTSDPYCTGAQNQICSLLDLDIDGSASGVPFVYSATDNSGVTATMTLQSSGGSSVPEPSTWPALLLVGILAGLARLGRALKARGFCI